MQHTPSLLVRLDATDRALFARWVLTASSSRAWRTGWLLVTHAGGTWFSVAAALMPLLWRATRVAGTRALMTLVISHLIVHALKRRVARERPARRLARVTLIAEPDRYSFPSGHSAAAMAIAFSYAVACPQLAILLCALALIVGLSRVCLGVHYPGDVMAGQAIAVLTGAVLTACW